MLGKKEKVYNDGPPDGWESGDESTHAWAQGAGDEGKVTYFRIRSAHVSIKKPKFDDLAPPSSDPPEMTRRSEIF